MMEFNHETGEWIVDRNEHNERMKKFNELLKSGKAIGFTTAPDIGYDITFRVYGYDNNDSD